MEELTDATPFDIFGGLSVEEAKVVLTKLAEFHARFWESPALDEHDWLKPFNHNVEGKVRRFREAADSVIEHLGHRLPEEFVHVIQLMMDRVDVVRALMARHPRTLIHGDFHPNNLFWRNGPDGRDVVVLDWQVVSSGRPERDLMYFLSSSLLPEVRRAHQGDLIAFYVEQLARHGIEGHTLEACVRGYRLALLDLVYFATIVLNILDFTINEEAEMILDLILERWGGSVTDPALSELLASITGGSEAGT
jgi:aminoglycoside phosphotransferase (APT) family kinase protein